MNNLKRGFTLIELLVVIAVLGVLATVVIVAINPFQQLAKARDAGRLGVVAQMGQAAVSDATTNNGTFITANNTWITTLVGRGEVAIVPGPIAYSIPGIAVCGTNQQSNLCYKASALTGPIIVYARLEATANISRCPAGSSAWAVYSSFDGRGGIVCNPAEPNAGATQPFLP
jgi:prepilin-type N-terminal cleavage/methylation domain-containing protein